MAGCDEEYPRTIEGLLTMRKIPYRRWDTPKEGEHNESKTTN